MIRLEELRKAKKLSQESVAQVLNITQQAYSHYERGKREPDYDTLIKLADYFNVSADYLLGGTDNPTPPSQKEKPASSEEALQEFLRNSDLSDEGKKLILDNIRLVTKLDSMKKYNEEASKELRPRLN